MLKWIGLVLAVMMIMLILLPALIVRGCDWLVKEPPLDTEPVVVSVYNHVSGQVFAMPLSEYLVGVVAAEMPASFDIEALKAQAVVARTYTLRKMRRFGGSGCKLNPAADICTDSAHCQAWVSKDQAQAKWPFFRRSSYWNKIVLAVHETRGIIITYEDSLIDALYHSTCGGQTEHSEQVWSNSFPYLRSVECGFCVHSPYLTETVTLSVEEVGERLGVGPTELQIEILARSQSGRIVQVAIGDQLYSGLELRQRLGLRSSRMTWLRLDEGIIFTTTGYGHGVGLCQYGADGMARAGYNFRAIIAHYYTGVVLKRVSWEE